MEELYNQISVIVAGYVPNLLAALAVLVLGWLVALVVAAISRGILRKTSLGDKISGWISGDKKSAVPVERYVSKAVFYFIMVFVLIAFFETLGLTIVTEPLNGLLNQLLVFLPNFLAAGLLLLAAWIIASLLKFVIRKALTAVKLDEQITEKSESKTAVKVSDTIANAVYWLIFLLFLPAVLNALQMQGLLEPMQGMLDKVLVYLPNLFTAAIILVVGWFLAGIIRKIISNLLAAVGIDSLSEKVGLNTVLGKEKFSGLIGLIVYVFILIPVILAALDALLLEAITSPVSNMLNDILAVLPNIFAAVLIIAVAYIVGRLVSKLIANLLAGLGFDKLIYKLGLIKEVKKETQTPSYIVGYIALLAIILVSVIEALQLLGFNLVSEIAVGFTVFAGNIFLGLIIFGLGLFLANLVSTSIANSQKPNSKALAMVMRVFILFISGAMALQQMGMAPEIVVLAFGLLLGALAVAAAIAFGIGGRDLAAKQLESWNSSFKKDVNIKHN